MAAITRLGYFGFGTRRAGSFAGRDAAPTTTIRERILARFATVLAATSGIDGRVYRSRATAVERSLQPCIMIDWNTEVPSPQVVGLADRVLTVQVSIMTRGASPDTLADAILQSAHALIMADVHLNGNAVDCAHGDGSFILEDTDQPAGQFTQSYEVYYRHQIDDLTQ